jgi:hypothetical protein
VGSHELLVGERDTIDSLKRVVVGVSEETGFGKLTVEGKGMLT